MWYTAGMNIVALDIGDRRIGIAVTDPFGSYAIPAETFFRTEDKEGDAKKIAELVKARGAELVVCGLPLLADGTEGEQARKNRAFAARLEALGIRVVFEDERFTTQEARGDLHAAGVTSAKDKKKKRVDSIAAAYILENYLAHCKRSDTVKEESNNYEDDENIVELTDDEGNTYRFEHLMTFEYKEEWYCALAPELPAEEEAEGDEEEGDEVAIYHIVGEGDDEQLETIEDDDLLDEVFAEFCTQYEDFEDADEAESLEPDADDGE